MPHQDRATLDRRLDELAAHMPQLLAETRVEDQMEAFAGIADEIRESAAPADLPHVDSRLSCILHETGLIPGDDGEPCDDA